MANLKIEMDHIATGTTFEIGKRYISSVSSLSQCQNDSGQLSYNVLSNTGRAEIIDEKDIIKNFLLDRVVDASVDRFKVKIFINDKCVQEHYSEDSSYDSSNGQLSLSLNGKMELLRSKKYSEKGFYDYSYELINLKAFFVKILKDIGCSEDEINNVLAKKYLYYSNAGLVTLQEVLENTTCNAIYVDEDNYADILENICEVAQINMFFNDDGEIDFTSSRPVISTEVTNNAIRIPAKSIYADLDYSVINHNSIDGVEIPTVSAGEDIFPLNTEDIYFTKTQQIKVSYDSDTGTLKPSSDYSENYEFEFIKASDGECGYLLCKFTSKFNNIDDKYKEINVSAEPWFSATYDSIDYESLAGVSYNTNTKSGEVYPTFESYEDFKTYVQGLADNVSYSSINGWQNVTPIIVGMIQNDSKGSYGFSSDGGEAEYLFAFFGTLSTRNTTEIARRRKPVSNATISFGAPAEMVYIDDGETSTYGDIDNGFTFERNTLITDTTVCKLYDDSSNGNIAVPMSTTSSDLVVKWESLYTKDIIAKNILSDYAYDVISGTIEVCFDDYYNIKGEKVVDLDKGEMIQTGQVIYIPNSAYKNRISGYWGVTGREFDYEGGPSIKLNVVNLKLV